MQNAVYQRYLEAQRELIASLEKNHKSIYNFLVGNLDRNIISILKEDKLVDYEVVENFKINNKQNLNVITDSRDAETAVKQFLLGKIQEILCIYINMKRNNKVIKKSVDSDIYNNNYKMKSGSDFIIVNEKEKTNMEVQSLDNRYKKIMMKKYKLEKQLKEDNNTILFICGVYGNEFTCMYIRVREFKKYARLEKKQAWGNKEVYELDISELYKCSKIIKIIE